MEQIKNRMKNRLWSWIPLILNSRSIVNFCEWGWVKKLVIFCGRRNCMTPNVNKATFLALVPELQRKSHPHFLVYVRSK